MWGNPYLMHMVWWLVPFFHVGTVVHLYRVLKAWSPSRRNHSVVPTFYTHGSIVDGWWTMSILVAMINALILKLSISCHTLNEHHCISALIQIPHNYLLHPSNTMCWNQIMRVRNVLTVQSLSCFTGSLSTFLDLASARQRLVDLGTGVLQDELCVTRPVDEWQEWQFRIVWSFRVSDNHILLSSTLILSIMFSRPSGRPKCVCD